ncbi:MAG: ImmA/IrrE family metallo-endopeptidase [Firmicutes bacterium]|nr:ImmA/IrrE family metallo-endopeptidase [Bacillota bacterium]
MVIRFFYRRANGIPILSRNEIETIAQSILTDYKPGIEIEPAAVDIEHLAEAYFDLQMDYQDLSHNRSILGMTVFADCSVPVYDGKKDEAKHIWVQEGTILIDNSLLKDDQIQRGRFTVGHEVGHWVLHGCYYAPHRGQLPVLTNWKQPVVRCRRADIGFQRRILKTDDDWLEWQADSLSSALLMPKDAFIRAALNKFKEVGLATEYYVRGADADLDIWLDFLARKLAHLFEVSVQATRIRLENLGLIREKEIEVGLLWA